MANEHSDSASVYDYPRRTKKVTSVSAYNEGETYNEVSDMLKGVFKSGQKIYEEVD